MCKLVYDAFFVYCIAMSMPSYRQAFFNKKCSMLMQLQYMLKAGRMRYTMLRLKLKFMFKNKQTRLILLLTLTVSLLITLIGLFSYNNYRKGMDTELNTPNVELLQINLDVTNRAFRESDSKAVDLAFQPAVISYVQAMSSGMPPSSEQELSLLKALSSEEDIHSAYIISLQEEALLSSEEGYISRWSDAADQSWIPWIQEINSKPLLIERRWTGEAQTPGQVELLSLVRPIVDQGRIIGAVMVNMDYDRFFSKMYTHLPSHQYVFNLDHELIYPKLNTSVPLEDMQHVIRELDVNPFTYVEVDGLAYMANQTFSDVTGWRLVSLVPMDQMLKSVNLARNMMLFLSLLSIVVGCSAIYYYNYAALRPVRRIQQLLNPGERGSRQVNLYELEPIIGKWVGEYQMKSLVAERSLPELRSKYVQDILNKSIGLQEVRTKWQHYFQDWEEGPLSVLVLSIDRYWQWTNEYREEDQMLLKYALHNIILEMLMSSWRAVSIAAEKDHYVIVVQPREAEHAPSLLEDAQRMIVTVQEYLHVTISIGVGSPVADVYQINQSYEEAREALSYRLYEGYGTIMEYATLPYPTGEYPRSILDDSWRIGMNTSLKSGDMEACVSWIQQWAEYIRKNGIQPSVVYISADMLVQDLLKLTELQRIELPSELAHYSTNQVGTMTLSEIEIMLSQAAVYLSGHMTAHSESREYKLVQEMIQYMKDNLHLNIGLQNIADAVRMSISSVSSIFKEETGSTVYDYLTTLRIEKACELLQDSSLKIADIAGLVGYQNENSFIRTFRKQKSVTPGKYRETFKSSSGYADPPNADNAGVFDDQE